MPDQISKSIDIYFDRNKKNISQWLEAYRSADFQIINGHQYVPTKKPLQDIYEYTLLDNHLSSVIEQRKSKVTGEDFAIFKNGVADENLTKLISKKWLASRVLMFSFFI